MANAAVSQGFAWILSPNHEKVGGERKTLVLRLLFVHALIFNLCRFPSRPGGPSMKSTNPPRSSLWERLFAAVYDPLLRSVESRRLSPLRKRLLRDVHGTILDLGYILNTITWCSILVAPLMRIIHLSGTSPEGISIWSMDPSDSKLSTTPLHPGPKRFSIFS